MKDIKKVKKAITHGGIFHLDDVMSTVLLKRLNKDITIDRCLSFSGDGDSEIIVFDIGFGKYDHHQKEVEKDLFGNPYSAFGLLFRDYGKQLLLESGFKDIDKSYDFFVDEFVVNLNYGDNFGYNNVNNLSENLLVKAFNPNWKEALDFGDKVFDTQFEKAVSFAEGLLDIWLRKVYDKVELEGEKDKIWSSALEKMDNGIIILPCYIPTKDRADQNEEVEIVITPSARGGYNITINDTYKYKFVENSKITFLHNGGFFASTKTLEDAIEVANEILSSGENI